MIISDFPVVAGSAGFPDFEYTGEYSILDDGRTSGEKVVAFLTSGTLTLLDDADEIIIQAQGGGGSGGAYSSRKGSDGKDGDIASYEGELAAGTYAVTIGAGGERRYNTSGSAGGTTTFGELLNAKGGAGGAYNGGGTLEHTSIYSSYGMGGAGGTSSHKSYNVDTGVTRYYGLAGNAGVVLLRGKA